MIWTKNKKIFLASILSSLAVFLILTVTLFFLFLTNLGGVSDRLMKVLLDRGNLSGLVGQDWYVINAVKKTSASVVSIGLIQKVPLVEPYYERKMFGEFEIVIPQVREKGMEKKEIGSGSGFIVSQDGYVITNKHVVESPDVEYVVYTNDGQKHKAEVVAKDTLYDVAVLKMEGVGYQPVELGDSDKLEVGQTLIAIGNALGEFRDTVSTGIVSGLSRSIFATGGSGQMEFLDEVIQTDAAINLGNSGGPLLDLRGRVVGVNVATAIGSQNIAFSLPINIVKPIINSVKKSGKIERPFLGIRYVFVSVELAKEKNFPFDYGILVSSSEGGEAVVKGSPAAKAGLKEGDLVLELDEVKIDKENTLARLIRDREVGEKVNLKIWRDKKEEQIFLVLGTVPLTIDD